MQLLVNCVCITKIVDEGQLQASQVLNMCFYKKDATEI